MKYKKEIIATVLTEIVMIPVCYFAGCFITCPIAIIVLWIWSAIKELPKFIQDNYYVLFMLYSIPAWIAFYVDYRVAISGKQKREKNKK